jgi:hypothetical protein
MSDPEAEATILHELAHVELEHDQDRAHPEARARDEAARMNGDRGAWEVEADGLGAAMADDLRGVLTDAEASIAFLVEDADRYLLEGS